jgi:hypothetical protein
MSQPRSQSEDQNQAQRELAHAILVLERQLNAYQRLHEEDLAALRQSIEELKGRIIALGDKAETDDLPSAHQIDDRFSQSPHS